MDSSTLHQTYKNNPNLLRGFSVVLEEGAQDRVLFDVVSASFPTSDTVRLMISTEENFFDDFINNAGGPVTAALRPHYFRVSTEGQIDTHPASSGIFVYVDVTNMDSNGNPDESASFGATHGGPTNHFPSINFENWDFSSDSKSSSIWVRKAPSTPLPRLQI